MAARVMAARVMAARVMNEIAPFLDRSLQIAALVGYLLGSIPWGLILTRLAGKGDIRKIGSGNIGTTNVLRTGSKGLAAATLLLDGGKGAAAVLLIGHFYASDPALIAGLAAVFGHNFPVWLRFQGGKGVATSLGVLIALAWPVGLIACAVWLLTAAAFRYSSLAALVALTSSPVVMALLADVPRTVGAVLLAILALVRHHANIRRLLKGEESKIGSGRASQPED